jgi:hypothetical protein
VNNASHRTIRTVSIVAATAVIAAGGSATAATLITGKSVKDGTLTGRDVKDRSLTSKDFKGSLPSGPSGPSGPAGPAGSAGPAGPAGPQGERGADGATGQQGPKGEQGPQGIEGKKGDTGTVDTSNFYDKAASDARYPRGRFFAQSGRFAHDGGGEVTLVTVPGEGSLSATCQRAASDQATLYWNPPTNVGQASAIFLDNGSGPVFFQKHYQDQTRASVVAGHTDRVTVEVGAPNGHVQLTVNTRLSDQSNSGYCQFWVTGLVTNGFPG